MQFQVGSVAFAFTFMCIRADSDPGQASVQRHPMVLATSCSISNQLVKGTFLIWSNALFLDSCAPPNLANGRGVTTISVSFHLSFSHCTVVSWRHQPKGTNSQDGDINGIALFAVALSFPLSESVHRLQGATKKNHIVFSSNGIIIGSLSFVPRICSSCHILDFIRSIWLKYDK